MKVYLAAISAGLIAMGSQKVILRTSLAFVPEVNDSHDSRRAVDLQAFHPPHFLSSEDELLHCLCPVRALHVYVQRTRALQVGDQLFVSWADSYKGKPISSQCLIHWVLEAIVTSYNSTNLQPPEGLGAARGVVMSWVLFKGISIKEICSAAS